MRYFEVEYLTVDFTRLTTEVEAKNEEEAEKIAFDESYSGLDYGKFWKELIDINEIFK